jgi:hypothetical protein
MNTYSNRRVANHLHGLIFELKERMNSRQDRPVMQKRNLVRMREKKKKKRKTYFSFFLFFFSFSFQFCLNCKVVDTPFVEFKYLANQYMFLYIGSKTFKFSKEQSNTKSSNVKEEKKKKNKTNKQANN